MVGVCPACVAVMRVALKTPPPLTDADLQKMTPQQVKNLFKKVALPEDDPDPDENDDED